MSVGPKLLLLSSLPNSPLGSETTTLTFTGCKTRLLLLWCGGGGGGGGDDDNGWWWW